jgi:hypothetical protein
VRAHGRSDKPDSGRARRGQAAELENKLEDEEQVAADKMSEWLTENLSEAIAAALPLEHVGIYDLKETLARTKVLPLITPTMEEEESLPKKVSVAEHRGDIQLTCGQARPSHEEEAIALLPKGYFRFTSNSHIGDTATNVRSVEALAMDRLGSSYNINSSVPPKPKPNNIRPLAPRYSGQTTVSSDLIRRTVAWERRYGDRMRANAARYDSSKGSSISSDEPAPEPASEPEPATTVAFVSATSEPAPVANFPDKSSEWANSRSVPNYIEVSHRRAREAMKMDWTEAPSRLDKKTQSSLRGRRPYWHLSRRRRRQPQVLVFLLGRLVGIFLSQGYAWP